MAKESKLALKDYGIIVRPVPDSLCRKLYRLWEWILCDRMENPGFKRPILIVDQKNLSLLKTITPGMGYSEF
ncbi:hypothetical protein [Microcoleus sp. S13C4]|uniref:hypothetical protein n=1 Tax=Microcoleus sp. S13C4 TaxID=3055410 RepID=UPI002FD699C9